MAPHVLAQRQPLAETVLIPAEGNPDLSLPTAGGGTVVRRPHQELEKQKLPAGYTSSELWELGQVVGRP